MTSTQYKKETGYTKLCVSEGTTYLEAEVSYEATEEGADFDETEVDLNCIINSRNLFLKVGTDFVPLSKLLQKELNEQFDDGRIGGELPTHSDYDEHNTMWGQL